MPAIQTYWVSIRAPQKTLSTWYMPENKMERKRKKRIRHTLVHTLRTLGLLVMVFCATHHSSCHAEQTLRVGIYTSKPFAFLDKAGQPQGLFVDILNHIGQQEDWDIAYIHGSWNDCQTRLIRGEIDLLANVARTAARAKRWNFTREYVILDWASVFKKTGSEIHTIFDLQGKTVSVLKNAITTTEFKNLLNSFGMTCRLLEKTENRETLRSVHTGEADAAVSLNIYATLLRENFQFERTSIVFAPIKLRFATQKGTHSDILARMDQHLVQLKKEKASVYHRFLDKWLGAEQEQHVLPSWFWWTLLILLSVTGISVLFMIMLNTRVHARTAALRSANERLNKEIADRQRTEEALRESEERFRQIYEHMRIGVAQVDLQFKVIRANQAYCDMLGYREEDLQGKHLSEFTHPEIVAENLHKQTQLAQGAIDHYQMEKMFIHRDGHTVHGILDANLIRDTAGNPSYFLGSVLDITARKQAEQQIHQLNTELEQHVRDRTAELEAANKELEAFSYSVSHDLRAPLRHIVAFVQLLEKDAADVLNEECTHYLTVISEAGQQMGRLIDALLSFSRMGRVEMKTTRVNMDDLIQNVLKIVQHETEGREIVWKVSPLPGARGDPAMLRLVLTNLITNALKFTREQPQAEIEIGHLPDNADEHIFYIRDNGTGFDMKYVDKLFGLFQRLHSTQEFEGTGLGLANIRRIIHRHGGRTWAEGEVGKGATFYFSFPKTE